MFARLVLSGMALLVMAVSAGLAAAVDEELRLHYRIMLDENVCMGTQAIEVAGGDEPNSVTVLGRIHLKFRRTIPITVEQDWTEVWSDGTLLDFASSTYENHMYERRHALTFQRADGKLLIENDGERISRVKRSWVPDVKRHNAPDSAVPATFWHEELVKGRTEFFGPKSGKPHSLDAAAEFMGEETQTVGQAQVALKRYAMNWEKKDQRDFWFGPNGLLYRYEHPSRGRKVSYTLMESESEAECPGR